MSGSKLDVECLCKKRHWPRGRSSRSRRFTSLKCTDMLLQHTTHLARRGHSGSSYFRISSSLASPLTVTRHLCVHLCKTSRVKITHIVCIHVYQFCQERSDTRDGLTRTQGVDFSQACRASGAASITVYGRWKLPNFLLVAFCWRIRWPSP